MRLRALCWLPLAAALCWMPAFADPQDAARRPTDGPGSNASAGGQGATTSAPWCSRPPACLQFARRALQRGRPDLRAARGARRPAAEGLPPQRGGAHPVAAEQGWRRSSGARPDRVAGPAGPGSASLEQYELRLLGSDRVAGRDAQVLLLKPRTSGASHSACGPTATGLMLRADVLGSNGRCWSPWPSARSRHRRSSRSGTRCSRR
jgi:hypothetical protein